MDVDLHHILSASGAPQRAPKTSTQASRLMRFRRARTLLGAVVLFWMWVWLGSASMIAGLFHVPLWAMLATYGLGVGVLVSLPLALGAAVQMHLMRSSSAPNGATRAPGRDNYAISSTSGQADVVRLPRRPAQPSARQLSKGA